MQLRDDPLRNRRRDRDHYAQSSATPELDRAADGRPPRGRARRRTGKGRSRSSSSAAGRAFCAGFDFRQRHGVDGTLTTRGALGSGKDLIGTRVAVHRAGARFMSLWRSPKPVIAQVHGWCVGGGIGHGALRRPRDRVGGRADRDAVRARVGMLSHRMWIYRLGSRAEVHALTGEPLSGKEAAEIGLSTGPCPLRLEATVRDWPRSSRGFRSQLAAMKLIINQAYENMGLGTTQLLGPVLDGYMRNTPEALAFVEGPRRRCAAAVAERDAPFRDYSQAPADGSRAPARDPAHGENQNPLDRTSRRGGGTVHAGSLNSPTIESAPPATAHRDLLDAHVPVCFRGVALRPSFPAAIASSAAGSPILGCRRVPRAPGATR